jgi:hypothetical protein
MRGPRFANRGLRAGLQRPNNGCALASVIDASHVTGRGREVLGNNKPALLDHSAITCVLDTSVQLITTTMKTISFTIDHSFRRDAALTSLLDKKLDKVGQDTFRYMLSFLDVFALLDYVSYSQDVISSLAEELLLKRRIIVKRVTTPLCASLQYRLNTIDF